MMDRMRRPSHHRVASAHGEMSFERAGIAGPVAATHHKTVGTTCERDAGLVLNTAVLAVDVGDDWRAVNVRLHALIFKAGEIVLDAERDGDLPVA